MSSFSRFTILAICVFFFAVEGIALPLKTGKKNQEIVSSAIEEVEFVKNKGQVVDMENNPRPDILYVGDIKNANIFLKKNGISYVMTSIKNDDKYKNEPSVQNDGIIVASDQIITQRIDADFTGCNDSVEIMEEQQIESYYNYYYAHCPNGITNVNAYKKISYKNIYDNINLCFYAIKNNSFKYDFIVNPGGNTNNISITYSGADDIEVQEGRLRINTSIGELGEWMPKVYQQINNKVIDVSGKYVLEKDERDKYIVKIKVGAYNKNYPLVIDPWVTYYGGSGKDECLSIATDQVGDVLVSGFTGSVNFPVTTGATLATVGYDDAFIVKFNSAGNRLWATYYGGSAMDRAYAVYCDALNNVIISGLTQSTNFPVSNGAFQTTHSGDVQDGMIVKFDPTGIRSWATYYGGNGPELCQSLVVDNNIIYTGGYTRSSDLLNSAGTLQPALNGIQDAFLAKFDSNGNNIWLSYFGGSGSENSYYGGINVDPSGNIAITGGTLSTDIPLIGTNFQAANAGGQDAYVALFNSNGNGIWSTYIGGSAADNALGIDADSFGNIIVAGYTASLNFPTTAGSHQATYAGGNTYGDAFIIKFDGSGNRVWCTYFGGTGNDEGLGVAVDANDGINICGDTYSNNFPVTISCAYQTVFGGQEDNFMAKFDKNGKYICSTYIGGSANTDDEINYSGTIAVHGGFVYIAGITAGLYPVTPGAFRTNYGGGLQDGFVMQLCGNTCGSTNLAISQAANHTNICVGTPVNYTATSASCDTSETTWEWTFTGGSPSTSTTKNPEGIIYNMPGNYTVKLLVGTSCGNDSIVATNYITVTTTSPDPAIASNDTTIIEGGSAFLNVTSGTSYDWFPVSGLSCTSCQQPTAIPKETTMYYVIVTDINGCTSIDSVLVNVEIVCDELMAPSAFSPNGDGQNDIFYVYANCVENILVNIFNRWGEKVFETTDITKGWDGKYKGNYMNTGVYVYTINAVFSNGKEIVKSGNVSLIR